MMSGTVSEGQLFGTRACLAILSLIISHLYKATLYYGKIKKTFGMDCNYDRVIETLKPISSLFVISVDLTNS